MIRRYFVISVLIASGCLLAISLLLTAERRQNSDTYWYLGRVNAGEPRMYTYLLLSSDGTHRRVLARPPLNSSVGNLGWFVAWSPDGDTIFYQDSEGQDGQGPGLYAYDISANSTHLLVPQRNSQRDVGMILSPDQSRFTALVQDGLASILYAFRTDGTDLHQLTPGYRAVSEIEWSPDGQWVYYGQIINGSFRNFRIHPDGSDNAQVPYTDRLTVNSPAHDGRIYITGLETSDEATMTIEWQETRLTMDELVRLIPARGPVIPIAWLPNNWLILEEQLRGSRSVGGNVMRLWRLRPDGSEVGIMFVATQLADVFWTEDGSAVFVSYQAIGQRRIARIDMDAAESHDIVDNYLMLFNGAPSFIPTGDPTTLLWSRDTDWLVWQEREPTQDTYYQARSDGSETHQLYAVETRRAFSDVHMSPDGKWLILAVDPHSPGVQDAGIIRVRLSDGFTENVAPDEVEYVAHSGIIDTPLQTGWLVGMAVVGLLGMLLIPLIKAPPRPPGRI